MSEDTVLLEMKDVWKVYPNGVVANKGINFSVRKGEIHALLGENGAGKSTLMKMLFGFELPTKGEILYEGKVVNISSPHKAIELGIGMVHQHFMLVPSLTVAENVVLGMEPIKGITINIDKAVEMVAEASENYGLSVPVTKKVKDISVGMKQRVEIIKTLIRGADLIILDEPTAVLTPQETVELFVALKSLVSKGKTVIFITHKLNEVKEIADRITVLRRGTVIGSAEVKDITEKDMSRMMVGRDVDLEIEKEKANPQESLLEVENLFFTRADGVQAVKNVSFTVHKGEILGVAGVEGNGQNETVQMITGILAPDSGSITKEGTRINGKSPGFVRKLGMSHIPADRMTRGIAEDATIEENIISDRFNSKEYSSKGVIKYKKTLELTKKLIEDFDIRTDGPKTSVRMLSGGNIQKVVVAREFTSDANVIIADQPTRGIDIAAADFIRRRLVEERDKNRGVLLISADLTELLETSDRIVVMHEGEIVANFTDIDNIDERVLGEYMLGIKKMTVEEMGDI